MLARLAIALVAISALAAVLSPAAAEATWPGKQGLVAYSGPNGIETVRPDGTRHRVVARHLSGGIGFAWSPGGRELAYSADGIWRMRADGSQKHLVVDSGYEEPGRISFAEQPAWGPGGNRLVFRASSSWSDPDQETPPRQINWIWIVNRDGTQLRKLALGTEAVWSRNGAQIRFIDEDNDVVEINPDGSGRRVLASNSYYTRSLDLAPDGRRLVYQTDSDASGRHTTVRTLDLSSGARTKFSAQKFRVDDVAWAPGGKRLTYSSFSSQRKREELRTIRPDGHGVRRVLAFPDRYWPVRDLAWQTR
jgi:Tol biopolymer transport system component